LAPEEGHDPVPWSPRSETVLDERLTQSLKATEREDGSEDIHWTCPRCGYKHVLNLFRDQLWAGLDGAGRSGEVDLRCECGFDHPNRPGDEVGCGYRTVVLVEEEEE
jgi:hypothetical protein